MKKFLILLIAAFPVFCYAQERSVLAMSDVHLGLSLTTNKDKFYHKDTDTALFLSAVKNAKKGKYPFIVMPGDLFRHDTAGIATRQKTYDYVIGKVQGIDKDAIVLPVLGNNDCIIHDTPDSATYALFYNSLLKKIDADGEIKKTFLKAGYYAYEKDNLCIIALNTVLFLHDSGLSKKDSCVMDQLTWLDDKLTNLKPGQSAWLVYHVPPGYDRYDESYSWQHWIEMAYLRIVKKHAAKIKLQLAGHTHTNDVRLLMDEGTIKSYIAITPGLDGRNGNNPAYQVLSYTEKENAVNKIITYYADSYAYKWQSFTFIDLDFKFFLNDKDTSSGEAFIKHYTTNRGTTKSSTGDPMIWNEYFRSRSKIDMPVK